MLLTITADQESSTFMYLPDPIMNVTDRTHLVMMHHAHWTGLHPLLMVDAGMTPLLGYG